MSEPKLTVAIPVKDGENFLAAALDSILAQTFSDFRIFISENGSSDGTMDIVHDYARRDSRIHFASDPVPMGQSPNHSKAVLEAGTEWVKLLCHDDLMREDCMAQIAGAIDTTDERVGLIGNGHRHLFANGYAPPDVRGKPMSRHAGPEAVRAFLGGTASFSLPAITTACVRRSAFTSINGFDRRWQHHDTMAWLQLLTGWDLIYLPDTLTDVRIHDDQVTHAHRKSLQSVDDWRRFIPEFLAEHGDELGLSPALRARVRLMPANVAARSLAIELRGGRLGTVASGLTSLPVSWLPLMPPLMLRAWIGERRRLAPLRGKVPDSQLVP